MPIMAPRTWSDRLWFTSFSTNTKPTLATKLGAINRGISTKMTSPSLISLRPPCPTPPNHDGRNDRPRLWRWYYPPGNPPVFYSTTHHDPSPPSDPLQQPSRSKSTTPRHRRRTLSSAHRRSLRRQRRRHQHVLATPLHFAPRQQKHSIKWLLKQTQIFPPGLSAPMTPDAHHTNDESSSSTIHHDQIDLYLSATALILNAALCDFEHDRKQQHPPPDRDIAAIALPQQQNDSTPINPHTDQTTAPQRRITRSMTAEAQRRNTVRIPDIDTNPHIHHATATQRTRQTVCIPDTDTTPWRKPLRRRYL